MTDSVQFCVNHPKTETRVRCTSCNSPICIKCMREASVGMKCPKCARPPLRARVPGKPRHYVAAAASGLGVSVLIGAVSFVLNIRIVGFIVPMLAGFVVGSMVVKAASGLSNGYIRGIAIITTGIGLLVAPVYFGIPLNSLLNSGFLFPAAVAAAVAGFRVGR